MSMGKRILGWLRQRRVAVEYGVVWCIFLLVIGYFFWETSVTIVHQVAEVNVYVLLQIYFPALFLLCALTAMRQFKFWRQSRMILTMRLILITVFVVVFQTVFNSNDGVGLGFYIGQGEPGVGLVSMYEVLFINTLFLVGSLSQWLMIEFEERRAEMNAVIGGVLIVMGILMPKLLESLSLLSAYCRYGRCTSGGLNTLVSFRVSIACVASMSAMFVVGLFSEPIVRFFRSYGEDSVVSKGSSLADSQNSEVPVSERAIATASDKQNKESEELPTSSSVATRMSQEAADGVVISAQATEALASTCGPGGAVSKQLMGAAVSGLVAGVCFSVVNRLLSRR